MSKFIEKTRARLEKNLDIPRVNLPALARRDQIFMSCFESDPGWSFVSQDFTSLEPTVTAHFSQDYHFKYACYDGIGKLPWVHPDTGTLMIDDIYLMTASRLPNTSATVLAYFSNHSNCLQWLQNSEVCKSHPDIKAARKYAKPACLGFNYGMGPRRFVNQSYDAGMYVTYEDAKLMYAAYWDLFKGVKQLIDKLGKVIEKNSSIINPFGYRLTTEPHKGYNAYIQSSASGVLDVYNLKFFSQAPYVKFVAIIHDETIFMCPDDRLEDARALSALCVKSLNHDLNFSVPMRLGFTIGKTFADIK